MELTEEESRRLAQELEVPLFLVDNDRQLYQLVDKLVERLGRKLRFEVFFTFMGEWFCEVATAAWCKARVVGPDRNVVMAKAICKALVLEDEKRASDVMDRAEELAKTDKLAASSLLIATFDGLFRRGQFALCDSILHKAYLERYSTRILVWTIKATCPGRANLSGRTQFIAKAKQVMEKRSDLSADAFSRLD